MQNENYENLVDELNYALAKQTKSIQSISTMYGEINIADWSQDSKEELEGTLNQIIEREKELAYQEMMHSDND